MKFIILFAFLPLCLCASNQWIQKGQSIQIGEIDANREFPVSLTSDGSRIAFRGYNNNLEKYYVSIYDYVNGGWLQNGTSIYNTYNDSISYQQDDSWGSDLFLNSDGTFLAINNWSSNEAPNLYVSHNVSVLEYPNPGIASMSSDDLLFANRHYSHPSHSLRISKLVGEEFTQLGDDFGTVHYFTAVAFSSNGSRVAIAEASSSLNIDNESVVRIYEWNGNTWDQMGGDITAKNGEYGIFGASISMSSDGSIVAIGSPSPPNGGFKGLTRVYEWSGESWNQLGADILGEINGDEAGSSISLNSNGSLLAIGGYDLKRYGNNSHEKKGFVRIFERAGNQWLQRGEDIEGTVTGDAFGRFLSFSNDGTTLAIVSSGKQVHGIGDAFIKVFSWIGIDTDNDGVSDENDAFPYNPNESIDTDGDGVGDNSDAFPLDFSEAFDSDNDGIGDNADVFPYDPLEWEDSDGDGIGDNADVFPNNPTEVLDTDNDGVGDNSDVYVGYPDATISNFLSNENYVNISDIQDLRTGSIIIEVSGNQVTVQLQMEESSDLETWTQTGDPATMTLPADTDTKFFRFKMTE